MEPLKPEQKLTAVRAPAPDTLYNLLKVQALYRKGKGNRRALRKLENELPFRRRP
jgi:uncharacterized protein YjiS (DUF1127 family)